MEHATHEHWAPHIYLVIISILMGSVDFVFIQWIKNVLFFIIYFDAQIVPHLASESSFQLAFVFF